MVSTITRPPLALRRYWVVVFAASVGEHGIAGKGGFVVRRVDEEGVPSVRWGEVVELAVEFFWDAVSRIMSM